METPSNLTLLLLQHYRENDSWGGIERRIDIEILIS